jgi:hypothetical protein
LGLNVLFFGFLSLSDSDSDDESDEVELEEEEVELDPDDDLSDGERVGFLFFCISLTGDTTDLTLSLFDEVKIIFFIDCVGGEGEGDFCLDFDIDCS